MTNTIEFPNLFSGELKVSRVALNVFGMDIYWYGVLITLGVVLGFLYAMKNAKKFGMLPDTVFDTAFIGTIGGFIGARIYYCIFNLSPNGLTKYNLITMFTEIRDGGLAIYGGVIGAVLTAFIYTRIKKIKISPILDLAGLGFLIGQGIGRWGNFTNQECFGSPTAGNLPWGMTGNLIRNSFEVIGAGENALVHPCFLYESLLCFIGLLLLHSYSKKLRTFDGEIFLLYAVWYGTGRGLIEGLRIDSLYAGEIRVSQLVGFASSVLALIIFIYLKTKFNKNKNYIMLCNNEDNKKYLDNYKEIIRIQNEKRAAVKALHAHTIKEKDMKRFSKNVPNGEAPSILGDGTSDIVLNDEKDKGENK